MWTWPLDRAVGPTTARRGSEGVADGTCAQVWVWMTNKCRKKMNQRKGYITSEISHKMGVLCKEIRKKERKKKEDGCSSYHLWKLSPLSTKESRRRRISPRTKPEDKLLPFLHAFDHSISLWSCPAVEALTKSQFLSPFSLPNLLYRACWVWAHSPNSKKPPKSGPYINHYI